MSDPNAVSDVSTKLCKISQRRLPSWAPRQACAYMIGELKILELRERAKQELGERFSLKAFHNLVLTMGSVPLQVLESEVDGWIEAERGKE